MDIDLPDLLKLVDEAQSDPLAESIRRMVGQVSTEVPSLIESDGTKYNLPAAILVWMTSHYSAAAAASHGFQVTYLERAGEQSLEPHLPKLAGILPTSTIVNFSRRGEEGVKSFTGGGEQSDFEKHDIKFLSHGGEMSNRSCALVINLNGVEVDSNDWIYAAISKQILAAYICVIRDAAAGTILAADQSPGWSYSSVRLGDAVIDIYANGAWEERVQTLKDLRFKDESGETGAYVSTKRARLVSANEFAGLAQIGFFPEETIAGSIIHIYSTTEGELCSHQAGRLGDQKTPDRRFYECQNVNVSSADLLWRDDVGLFDRGTRSGLSPADAAEYRVGGSIGVSEPTRQLKGTYFLAPTMVPHHSHLMFETLRRLNIAARYKDDIKILATNILTPSQRDYFHVFGFGDDRCVYRGINETVNVERLVFTIETPHLYDRMSIEYFRRIAMPYYAPSHTKSERIYFSRRDVRKYRNLVNEAEVEEVFKKFGFTIVMASDLSAEEKVDLMSTAKYVSGPLGAAQCYMPFSLDGELIALTSDLYFPGTFHQVSGLRIKDIHFIKGIGLKFYADPWRFEHSSFYVDPLFLATALNNIVRQA